MTIDQACRPSKIATCVRITANQSLCSAWTCPLRGGPCIEASYFSCSNCKNASDNNWVWVASTIRVSRSSVANDLYAKYYTYSPCSSCATWPWRIPRSRPHGTISLRTTRKWHDSSRRGHRSNHPGHRASLVSYKFGGSSSLGRRACWAPSWQTCRGWAIYSRS